MGLITMLYFPYQDIIQMMKCFHPQPLRKVGFNLMVWRPPTSVLKKVKKYVLA